MTKKIEVFSAGCPLCEETVQAVQKMPAEYCQIVIHDMAESFSAQRAKELGVARVPAIAVDGKLLSCCETETVNLDLIHGCKD